MVRQGAEVMGYKYCVGMPHKETGFELDCGLDLRIKVHT